MEGAWSVNAYKARLSRVKWPQEIGVHSGLKGTRAIDREHCLIMDYGGCHSDVPAGAALVSHLGGKEGTVPGCSVAKSLSSQG